MYYFTSDLHLGHANIIKYSRRPFQNSTESMLIELAYKGIIPLSELSVSSESLESMDNQIIKSINSTVKKEDHLVIIGDFCFASSQYKETIVEKYTNQINCKNTILILGNHDDKKIMLKHFQQVHDYFVFNIYGKNIITSHYPMRTWYKQSKNSWMLYGHTHGLLHEKDVDFLSKEEECNLKSTLGEFIKDPNVNINDIIESYRRKFTRKYTLDVGVDNHVRRNIEFGTPWSFKEIQEHMNKK